MAPADQAMLNSSTRTSTAVPGLTQTPFNLTFSYESVSVPNRGHYYQIENETDLHRTGSRPILPRTTLNLSSDTHTARGVLMLGGTFADEQNFDPAILGINFEDTTTDQANGEEELRYDVPQWYLTMPASVNRMTDISKGASLFRQQLVVVPGQFHATSTADSPSTVGTMRLYSDLQLLVYSARSGELGNSLDFLSPSIWAVSAASNSSGKITFNALVEDPDPGANLSEDAAATGIMRVVVLYRHVDSHTWSRVDLDYNQNTLEASKTVNINKAGQYEYFVQAVDNAGNVSALMNHGNYFTIAATVDSGSDDCSPVPGNIIANFCFQNSAAPWKFFTDGQGNYSLESTNPYAGATSAKMIINAPGSNVQLYQTGLTLQPNTNYELSFAAYSNNGRDMSIFLHKHGAPHTNYGIANHIVDLTTSWKTYTISFTTPNTANLTDGRLRFWFAPYDAAGTVYYIDRVVLQPAGGGGNPDPDPEPPPTPGPGECGDPISGNLIKNPGFEASKSFWSFFSDKPGSFNVVTGQPYECTHNAKITVTQRGTNVQLFQTGFTVKPNTSYRLRLAARASNGEDMQLFLHRHSAPYTNLGLNGATLDLTKDWKVFIVDFTTGNFGAATNDTRLRFWLSPYGQNGTIYEFDDVVMTELTQGRSGSEPSRQGGRSADDLLIQGYFIDDDTTGRLAGTYVSDGNENNVCREINATLSTLSPVDGLMHAVNFTGPGISDHVTLLGVWQDEPVGLYPDAEIHDSAQVMLRSERDESGNGRVYTIAFATTDENGKSCNYIAQVGVGLDTSMAAIDDGYQFNSLESTSAVRIPAIMGSRQ